MLFPVTSPLVVCARGGGGGALGQVARIKEGFVAAGCRVTDDPTEASLVYANDPSVFAPLLDLKRHGRFRPGAKLVLNVLDLAEHLLPPAGDYTLDKVFALGNDLRDADAVTAISAFTRAQLQRYLGLAATVVSNPIKDVTPAKRRAGERPYPYRALLAGRTNDPNKRIRTIGIPAMLMAGLEESEVAVVGGEWPGWGTNLGVVSDEVLNDLYNSVDFVMQPTQNTGLELPIIEAMACGAIPLVCYDLSTFADLPLSRHWGCYPSATAVAYRLRLLMENDDLRAQEREHCLNMSKGIREHFGKDAVARRIIEVYRRIAG